MHISIEVVEWNGAFAFKSNFTSWRKAVEWIEKQGEVTLINPEKEVMEYEAGLSRVRSRRYVVDNKDTFLIIERRIYAKPNTNKV